MSYNYKRYNYGKKQHIEVFTSPIYSTVKERENEITDVIEKKKIKILSDLQRDINKDHNLSVSVNRSKRELIHIARSNNWNWFITITFDPEYTDSTNYDECAKKITKWLNNLKQRKCPNLKYLLVPELHPKYNVRYHFHGLLANTQGFDFVDSGHVDKFGEIIYNINNWKIGFTTAEKIRDSDRAAMYVCKYISKDLLVTAKYRKRYFCSDNSIRVEPEKGLIPLDEIYDNLIDPDRIESVKTIGVQNINRIKYFEVNNSIDISKDDSL